MTGNPRVSIVTPSFNQGSYLEHTILSVLEQDYPELEYFIMDGGSTDDSVEIIRKYARHLTYWQSGPDGGQVRAINAGLQKATGEIFTFLNSDDFLLQGAIQHIAGLYREHPQAAGWVGGGYCITQDGFILQSRATPKVGREDVANWEENWILQPACFFSAKFARAVGYFDPRYENAFDFDFWMKITTMGDLILTPQVLAAATIHNDTKTIKYLARMFEETQSIQRAYGFESFALATNDYLTKARAQKPAGKVAKLIYETYKAKQKAPDRYVRFPERLKEG